MSMVSPISCFSVIVLFILCLSMVVGESLEFSVDSTGHVESKNDIREIIETRGTGRQVYFPLPSSFELPDARYPSDEPGTLLLNMLTKNERDHLDRVLPLWAKTIDCWVIGIDKYNTDDSEAVIQKHLGHLPGRTVVVEFDGMGPSWSELVKVGYEEFSQCTHGIISDADFAPRGPFNKRDLDTRCSKHMFTIWTQDMSNARRMDWIYRNIPGARVSRRTHQMLDVPSLPNQEVFQTLTGLEIVEQEGGYQDRTPGKMERYIGFLEADLEENPGDSRSLYYIGYAYFDLFTKITDYLTDKKHPMKDMTRVPKWRTFIPPVTQTLVKQPERPHAANALHIGRNMGDVDNSYILELNGEEQRVNPIFNNPTTLFKFASLPASQASQEALRGILGAAYKPVSLPASIAKLTELEQLDWLRWVYLEAGVRYMVARLHTHHFFKQTDAVNALLQAMPSTFVLPPGGVHEERCAGCGNNEERYFATLKVAEMYERYYRVWSDAEMFYNYCIQQDRARADAWFYIGQQYRLQGRMGKAAPILFTAATLPIPERSLFMWHTLYTCVAPLELAVAVLNVQDVDVQNNNNYLASLFDTVTNENQQHIYIGTDTQEWKLTRPLIDRTISLLKESKCDSNTRTNDLIQKLQDKLEAQFVQTTNKPQLGRAKLLLNLIVTWNKHRDVNSNKPGYAKIDEALDGVRSYLEKFDKLDITGKVKHAKACKFFRLATNAILKARDVYSDSFDSNTLQKLQIIAPVCR